MWNYKSVENIAPSSSLGIMSPLKNHLIIGNVLKRLSDSEKRKARLVCQSWKNEVELDFKAGITRPTKEWIKLANQKPFPDEGIKLDFKNLNTILMDSSAPEIIMEFIKIDELGLIFHSVTEPQICFKYYGMHIKSLSINDLSSIKEEFIHKIVYTLCPNLVCLQLGYKYYMGDYKVNQTVSNTIFETSATPLNWSKPLKSLKILTLNENCSFEHSAIPAERYKWVMNLIQNASSLSYFGLSNEMLDHLLPHVLFNAVKPLQKLETLIFDEFNDDGAAPAVNRILEIVADNIQELHLDATDIQKDPSWHFILMSKLMKFSVELNQLDGAERLQIRRIFNSMPNLESLKIGSEFCLFIGNITIANMEQNASRILFHTLNYHQNEISYPLLKVFKLYCYGVTYQSVQKICKIFPNLESLSLKFFMSEYNFENNHLINIATTIRSLEQLEILEIAIVWLDTKWVKNPKLIRKFYTDLRQFLLPPNLNSLRIITITVPHDLKKNSRAYSQIIKRWNWDLEVVRNAFNGSFTINVHFIF